MFICCQCGNSHYFTSDVAISKTVSPIVGMLKIDNLRFADRDLSEQQLRDGLQENIENLKKLKAAELFYDPGRQRYYSEYLSCARCGSDQVIKHADPWNASSSYTNISDELTANRLTYLQLIKEKNHADNLPVLWRPD